MKAQAYRLFEIVAWPAVVWCPVEAAMRGATGDATGAGWAFLLGAMALAMVGGCRLATTKTAAAPVR